MILLLGAGRGLGRALLRFFLHRNIPLFCVTRSRESMESLRNEFSGARSSLMTVEAFDLSDRQSSRSMVDRMASPSNQEGFPVLAIYTAGFLSGRVSLFEESIGDLDREVEANFLAPLHWSWLLTRQFVMLGKGGHLFISSGVARSPRPHWGGYGVSKGALEALSAQLALDLPPPLYSLTLNPGGMATEMRHIAYPQEDQRTLPSPEVTGERIGHFCLSLMDGHGREFNGKRLQMGDL